MNNVLLGEYHSAFKGQGMTFSEFREYVPGDDVRTIAWSLAARTARPTSQKYDEEREMTVVNRGRRERLAGFWQSRVL